MADHDTGDAEGVAAAEASGPTDSNEAEEATSAGKGTDGSPAAGSKKSRMLARKPLIAAGAVAVVVVAAIAAFFVLWPDPPSRSAGGKPSGTATNGPWLRGTYQAHNDIQAPIGHYTNDHVLVLTSECPGCDATASGDVGTGDLHWNGAGWEASAPTDCGQVTSAFTIGPVLNGVAQQVSSNWSMCDVNVTTTLTRTGD